MMMQDDQEQEDPISTGRGIVYGLVIGAIFWAGLIAGIVMWVKR